MSDIASSSKASEPSELGDVLLTPTGRLKLEAASQAGVWPDPAVSARLNDALNRSSAEGLLLLATRDVNALLPPAATWWRMIARSLLNTLCHSPQLEAAAPPAPVPTPTTHELESWISHAPLMRGNEYLSPEIIHALWAQMDLQVRAAAETHPGGIAAWLRSSHPLWRTIGRVTFHLAENKKHPTHPFAFMATYASGMSSQAKVQHLPLGRALEEYSGAGNKAALLNLLSPVQRAAEKSAWIRELVDSGRIYKPMAWSPAEAHRLLKDTAALEDAGVLLRLPDWWKSNRPPRPRISVRIGQNRAAGLGTDQLLDFSAQATLDGDPLTDDEWQQLMSASSGLLQMRGKWVEVDQMRLQDALQHWKAAERMMRKDGISFHEGMRLMAGFTRNTQAGVDPDSTETDTEWAGIEPGDWLSGVLEELRDPAASGGGAAVPGLQATLRPYQAAGVHWLYFLSRLGLGGCLADDMGLGKTIQTLGLLLRRKSEASHDRRSSLLVLPASLLANWRDEIRRFAPSLSCVVIHPSEPTDLDQLIQSKACLEADLVITSYGILTRLTPLQTRAWDLVILDEAHAIKNPGTRQARAVKGLTSTGRFALTGTPVENRAGDLWALFDFINPGLLGSASEFGRFTKAREKAEQPDYSPLRALTRPYILRRLKTDKRIIQDLPDKTEVRAWCSLSKTQAALYQQAVKDLAESLEASEGIQRKGLVLSYIMRFKQICNHPSHYLNDGVFTPEQSGKFSRLAELCSEIASRQEKVLVFTQFQEMTDPLSQYLSGLFGRPGLVLHGGTAVAERRHLVKEFQSDDGPPFFVLTVKAGGTGLTLTQASHVIHFDRWWNPAVENQATDRAFRIGQKKNVLVHKFIARGTIEERVDQLIEDKKNLGDALIEGGSQSVLTEMNNEELLRFVNLDLKRALDV